MRFAITFGAALLSILLCADAPAASVDDDADDLVGVWALRSLSLRVPGAPRDIFGSNPKGYLIFTPEGRMMTIITRADRKPATTIEEQAALLQSMVAYSGQYTVGHDRIVTYPDVSWNEIYTGTEQTRYYTISGDTLSIRTAEQPSALLPGRRVVATLTYERQK
jgi:hypothetical protein